MLELFKNIFPPPRDLILVVAAIWVGLWVAEKRSARHGINTNDLNNLIFYPFLGYVLGGRALFILENWAAFAHNTRNLFSINMELFDPIGGLAAALLAAFIYGKRKRLSLWPALDAITPFLAVLAIGLGLAHLASGSAFGKETSLPWGIELWGTTRHPSQIYEILAALLIFGLLSIQRTDSPPGVHFLIFAALTSSARLFLEAFRGDSTIIFGGLRFAQVVAWVVLAITLLLFDILSRKNLKTFPARNDG